MAHLDAVLLLRENLLYYNLVVIHNIERKYQWNVVKKVVYYFSKEPIKKVKAKMNNHRDKLRK